MRDVHQRDSQGTWTRMFVWCDVDRLLERASEWLLIDVSIAIRSWRNWSAVSTRQHRLGLHSMLSDLLVAFAMRIRIDAAMETHWRSMQGHRRTEEHVWLTEYVEPFHSGREEIGLAHDMILEALPSRSRRCSRWFDSFRCNTSGSSGIRQ